MSESENAQDVLTPRYPDVHVPLVGEDGNSVAIVARVARALRKAGAPDVDVASFVGEAFAGSRDELLQTCIRWVQCD